MKKNYNNSNSEIVSRIIRDGGGVTSDRHQTGWVRFAHTAPYRKCGFTLAEVLITLGIIGVVAALTLPNLIAQHKKQTYVTQLRKTVSTIEQGFQKMRADAGGVDSLEDTEPFMKVFNSDVGECYGYDTLSSSVCQNFYHNDLKKYFNIVDNIVTPDDHVVRTIDGITYVDELPNEDRLVLSDGSMLIMDAIQLTSFGRKIVGGIWIDVNGIKPPNIYGYDVFGFEILLNGMLFDNGDPDRCKLGNTDHGCYNYLARNGWKMDY